MGVSAQAHSCKYQSHLLTPVLGYHLFIENQGGSGALQCSGLLCHLEAPSVLFCLLLEAFPWAGRTGPSSAGINWPPMLTLLALGDLHVSPPCPQQEDVQSSRRVAGDVVTQSTQSRAEAQARSTGELPADVGPGCPTCSALPAHALFMSCSGGPLAALSGPGAAHSRFSPGLTGLRQGDPMQPWQQEGETGTGGCSRKGSPAPQPLEATGNVLNPIAHSSGPQDWPALAVHLEVLQLLATQPSWILGSRLYLPDLGEGREALALAGSEGGAPDPSTSTDAGSEAPKETEQECAARRGKSIDSKFAPHHAGVVGVILACTSSTGPPIAASIFWRPP